MASQTPAAPSQPHVSFWRIAASWVLSWEGLICIALLGLGLVLRMISLTDPPLDFHPTRQLRAAIIARGMYYQTLPDADPKLRENALSIWATMERYEPPILEKLVATTYRLIGSEQVWVARIYSSLFWLIGGMALFALVRKMLSPIAGLCSLAFYLILPWGVTASRAFQPDPWMVMWVLLSAYALFIWAERGPASWLWATLSGLFCGLAMLVKAYSMYAVVLMALGVLPALLQNPKGWLYGFLRLVRMPQPWLFALLAAVIPGIYYLGLGERSSEFASFWIFSFTDLLLDRKFYIHWLGLISGLMDVVTFFAALSGVFLLPKNGRLQMLGLWGGYFLIGATFPFQIYTHDYYSILLVPAVAIGLSPFFHLIFIHIRLQPRFWQGAFLLAFLGISGYYTWVARSQVVLNQNYRKEPIPWQIMGEELPDNGAIIGLTHDYGNRLKYYGWRTIMRIWPSQADIQLTEAAGGQRIDDFEPYFRDQTAGMDYFLVTLFGDLEAQPLLKETLYSKYPIAQEGDGYVLFDLRNPKP